jgi:thiol:disulfide interchange protein
LGLGMAAPYLLASGWPGLVRALPRPGAWMGHFKTVMAFPMFATVIWLVWVVGHQTGVDGAAGLLGVLLALAFLVWAVGSPQLSTRARRGFAAVAMACVGLTLAWAAPSLTGAMTSSAQDSSTAAGMGNDAGWGPWSENRVRTALDAQQPVFVDFTAAWCVTCQFNKRTVLNQPEVLADMQAKRVILLRADWTRKDSAITAELARMGRNGVPVYALHVPGEAQPRLLGEILSVQHVRDALKGLP